MSGKNLIVKSYDPYACPALTVVERHRCMKHFVLPYGAITNWLSTLAGQRGGGAKDKALVRFGQAFCGLTADETKTLIADMKEGILSEFGNIDLYARHTVV